MSDDIKIQIVDEIRNSPMFALQLDESTVVPSCAQVMVYIRYLYGSDFKDEYLFCSPQTTRTRGIGMFDLIDEFLIMKIFPGMNAALFVRMVRQYVKCKFWFRFTREMFSF